MVFPRLDLGSTVLVDPGKPCTERKPVKKAGCSDGKCRRYEKGGIVAIVEGETHGGLGLRGGLLGVQTQSHIGRIIISKLTYKLGGLLLPSPIGFRMEPQLGLYVRLGEMLGLGYPTSGIKSSVAQRRLEDKQPEEKTNTDCLSTQQCMKSGVAKHLGVTGIQQQNRLVNKTNVTLLAKEVQTQDLIYYHPARDREQHSAWELFSYREDSNEAAFAVAAVEKIYAHESLTFNNTVACEVISKWKVGLEKMKWILDQWIHNEKLVQTLLKGHSILSLEGSLSEDCDVEKNGKWSCIYAVGSQEYQMVCTRLDIASADVGMLDKFDCGLETDVQVFVDFDYAMGRSITRTLAELGYELSLVAGIATGALVKGGSRFEVPAQVEGAAYRY
ncbi:hypothetical protein Tco_0921279 [Tanacetum coccineum]